MNDGFCIMANLDISIITSKETETVRPRIILCCHAFQKYFFPINAQPYDYITLSVIQFQMSTELCKKTEFSVVEQNILQLHIILSGRVIFLRACILETNQITCFFYKHDVYKHIQAQVW